MARKISKPVGQLSSKKKGNDPKDVAVVKELLNTHIARGLLTDLKPLDAKDGSVDEATIEAIEAFQKRVVGLKKPDGRVDPGGKTIAALNVTPKGITEMADAHMLALTNVAKGPIGGVPDDLWNSALNSLIEHAAHPKLYKYHLITIVDFRKPRTEKRLWTVDLRARKVLFHSLVSHGAGKGARTNGKFAKFLSNMTGSHESSVGAYVTLQKRGSTAGFKKSSNPKKKRPALVVEGLDSTNSKAKPRAILFHGATYVDRTAAYNSWGCFATRKEINDPLVEKIRDGSFVYAYSGTSGGK